MHWACQAMAPHKLLIPCAFIFLKIICPGSTVENTTQPCLIFINLQTFSGEFTHNLVCFTQPPAPKASPPSQSAPFSKLPVWPEQVRTQEKSLAPADGPGVRFLRVNILVICTASCYKFSLIQMITLLPTSPCSIGKP